MTEARLDASELLVALSTAPDHATAERIARALVDERLIACANLIPGLTSVFRWREEVQAESEVLILMKTRRDLLRDLADRLGELHPYDVPELLGLAVEGGLPAYCRWVWEETEGQ